MVTLYTITLTIACCVAVALVIGSDRRARGTESSWSTPSTFAVLSATCATLSTLAYAMSGPNDENILPLVIGDISQPLCIGLLLAAVRLAAGKARNWAIYTVLISLSVGATTLLVSPEAGQAAKLLALALFSAVTTYTCIRERLPQRGAWLIGVTTAVYGAYCLARFTAPFFIPADSPVIQYGLARGPATIVAAVSVGMIAWGMISIIRQSQTAEPSSIVNTDALVEWISALLAQRSEVAAIAVSVPDLPLHRSAFGRVWAQSIASAVTEATRATMPIGSVIGRVAPGVLVAIQFTPTVDLESVQARLQEAYLAELPCLGVAGAASPDAPHPNESLPGVSFRDAGLPGVGLPDAGPTELPELRVELLAFTAVADLRHFVRQARATARRAMSSQGM